MKAQIFSWLLLIMEVASLMLMFQPNQEVSNPHHPSIINIWMNLFKLLQIMWLWLVEEPPPQIGKEELKMLHNNHLTKREECLINSLFQELVKHMEG